MSRERSFCLILLPQVSTKIRLPGQETRKRSQFFTCIFWLTLKTKLLSFFFLPATVSKLVNKHPTFYSEKMFVGFFSPLVTASSKVAQCLPVSFLREQGMYLTGRQEVPLQNITSQRLWGLSMYSTELEEPPWRWVTERHSWGQIPGRTTPL